jgi:arsenate reductase
MAEGWAKQLGLDAESAGTNPGRTVAEFSVSAMAEKGIDISKHTPAKLADVDVDSFDMIFSMGCGVYCPELTLTGDWQLADPYGGNMQDYRETRDEIERQVRLLIE